ncbi:unnamed protein product, partial [Polarella glacialis]
ASDARRRGTWSSAWSPSSSSFQEAAYVDSRAEPLASQAEPSQDAGHHELLWVRERPVVAPQTACQEYRIYIQSILRPFLPDSLRAAVAVCGGRRALEEALGAFMTSLKIYVTGCDDRKLSRAGARRARGIETQLIALSEKLLVGPLKDGLLLADDLHGIWHGFAIMRGWRDCRLPQEILVQMLSGALEDLDEDAAESWRDKALTKELACPEVHQAISVQAWPALCQVLGRLPDC